MEKNEKMSTDKCESNVRKSHYFATITLQQPSTDSAKNHQ